MPAFKVDDRFQVPDEMHGAKLQWLGKQGTVVRVALGSASGPPLPMEFQPTYVVLFDGATDPELLDEGMMRPVEPD